MANPAHLTSGRHVRYMSRALWLVLLVAALIVLALSPATHAWLLSAFEQASELIESHPVTGAMSFVGLAAVSAMLAFFSSSLLVAPAVYAWGPTATVALLWLGWMLGGVASYSLARWIGRPALSVLLRRRSLDRLEAQVGPTTPFLAVFLFQVALPSEIPGCVLGIVRHPMGRYLAALALAELPWAVGTVLLGESFVERRIGTLVALGVAALAASLLVARLVRRHLTGPASLGPR
ncbi:MAG TPA: VTT domain-containing protein [Gemmatimonadaceae bacterium]